MFQVFNVLKWSSIASFGLTLTLSSICQADPENYKDKEVFNTSSVNGGILELFPARLKIVSETLKHSSQHYPEVSLYDVNQEFVPFKTLKAAFGLARKDRSTTVWKKESLEKALQTMTSCDFSCQPDKKAFELLISDADTVGYLASFLDEKGRRTDFEIVICIKDSCDDDAGGKTRPNVFHMDEVVSIYPLCGPDVFQLPEQSSFPENLDQAFSREGKMMFKIKIKDPATGNDQIFEKPRPVRKRCDDEILGNISSKQANKKGGNKDNKKGPK